MNRITTFLAVIVLLTADSVTGAEPILEWRFDGASSPGAWLGKFGTPADGPRPPKYPGFETNNQAMSFAGHDGAIVVKDHERGGFTNVRFGEGDTFGFETWVKFRSIGKGEFVYVVGKGRHIKHGEDFPETNQNYSVRFQGTGSGARIGLLFTSEHPETKKRAWHRWWSNSSVPAAGWHHVALQYTFGKANSLQAWIDGKSVRRISSPFRMPTIWSSELATLAAKARRSRDGWTISQSIVPALTRKRSVSDTGMFHRRRP
jgi:hypothetical protein